jgi:hypothetical protein
MTARKSYRVLAFLTVVVALVAGILVLGRISDNATVSMGLTAVWFGLVFLVAVGISLRIRNLFGLAPTLFDKKSDERIVTGAPASPSETDGSGDAGAATRSPRRRPRATSRSPRVASPRLSNSERD